jgi:hypothetical protein
MVGFDDNGLHYFHLDLILFKFIEQAGMGWLQLLGGLTNTLRDGKGIVDDPDFTLRQFFPEGSGSWYFIVRSDHRSAALQQAQWIETGLGKRFLRLEIFQ